MVIYVPPGDSADPTRNPAFYDTTYRYLAEIGIPELPWAPLQKIDAFEQEHAENTEIRSFPLVPRLPPVRRLEPTSRPITLRLTLSLTPSDQRRSSPSAAIAGL